LTSARASFENLNVSEELVYLWEPALQFWQGEWPDFLTIIFEGIVEKVQQDEIQEGNTSLDRLRMGKGEVVEKKLKPSSPSKLFSLGAPSPFHIFTVQSS